MTEPIRPHPRIDAATLWAGGVAAAFVAALIAAIGVIIGRGIMELPGFVPDDGDGRGPGSSAAWAALAALLATGLMHLLALSTPQPRRFFAWIMTLTTLAAVLLSFLTQPTLGGRLATAGIHLVLGVAIGVLVAGSAQSAMHKAALRANLSPARYRTPWAP